MFDLISRLIESFTGLNVPDGYISHDLIHWGKEPSKNALVAKGCIVELPDLTTLSFERANDLHNALRSFFKTITTVDEGVMVRWSVDAEYGMILDPYEADTDKFAGQYPEFSRMVRRQRAARWRSMAERSMLRRERIVVFFTQRCSMFAKGSTAKEPSVVDAFLRAQAEALDNRIRTFKGVIPGGKVIPMDDIEHFRYFYRFFNPEMPIPSRADAGNMFDPQSTILANCVQSDAVTEKLDDGTAAFRMGGKYHSILVATRWPTVTHPLILSRITRALNKDFEISVGIIPHDLEKLKDAERHLLRRNRRQAASGEDPSADVSASVRDNRLRALEWGEVRPYSATWVVRVWADNLRELAEKRVALQTAINTSGGMCYQAITAPGQAKNLLAATFPGRTHHESLKKGLYAEDGTLADMVPFQCSFTGMDTNRPQAMYESDGNSLVRLQLAAPDGTPQHTYVIGVSRAGKDVLIQDVLTQTDPYYQKTYIIDEGLSYAIWVKLQGSDPVVLTADCPWIFNVFDTHGGPLTTSIKSTAVALFMQMIGSSGAPDIDNTRSSIIGAYVSRLFDEAFSEFQRLNRKRMSELQREAMAIYRWWKEKSKADAELIDAFAEIKERAEANDREWRDFLESVGNTEAVNFATQTATRSVAQEIMMARFAPTDFPTLSQLVEGMRGNPEDTHNQDEVYHLATLLAQWTREGANGGLFDGHTNFKMDGRVVCFELSKLGKSQERLKSVVAFLAGSWIRQQVTTSPRHENKRVIFGEATRFMDVPGADKIVEEYYAQLGKCGCWVCLITQSYSQMSKHPLFASVLSNSKIGIILKQKNSEDLKDLAKRVQLPDSAVERILEYRFPQTINPEIPGPKPVAFTLLTEDGNGQVCGTAYNLPDREAFYVALAGGTNYDRIRKDLSRYEDTFAGVLEESARMFPE